MLVGAERFELPTLCSQSRCATRLRYAPTFQLDCTANRLKDECRLWELAYYRARRAARGPAPRGWRRPAQEPRPAGGETPSRAWYGGAVRPGGGKAGDRYEGRG